MFESPKNERRYEDNHEKFERTGEKISEERGGLFGRIMKRILEEREDAKREILDSGDVKKAVVDKIKEIPVLVGVASFYEGLVGARYGKLGERNVELKIGESIVKSGVGSLLMAKGFLQIDEFLRTGNTSEYVLGSKVLNLLEADVKKMEEKDPESKKTKALRAALEYLKSRPDVVKYYEDRISEVGRK